MFPLLVDMFHHAVTEHNVWLRVQHLNTFVEKVRQNDIVMGEPLKIYTR